MHQKWLKMRLKHCHIVLLCFHARFELEVFYAFFHIFVVAYCILVSILIKLNAIYIANTNSRAKKRFDETSVYRRHSFPPSLSFSLSLWFILNHILKQHCGQLPFIYLIKCMPPSNNISKYKLYMHKCLMLCANEMQIKYNFK